MTRRRLTPSKDAYYVRVDVRVPLGLIPWVARQFNESAHLAEKRIAHAVDTHAQLYSKSFEVLAPMAIPGCEEPLLSVVRNFDALPREGERWFDCEGRGPLRMLEGVTVKDEDSR